MAINVKEFSDHYAYDISKNVLSRGEIHDEDVINQSIELILTTMFNERLFNLGFGCVLGTYLFHFINQTTGERLLDSIIGSVTKWEDRVRVISKDARLQILSDQEAIILTLPYTIKQTNIGGTFKKKIKF